MRRFRFLFRTRSRTVLTTLVVALAAVFILGYTGLGSAPWSEVRVAVPQDRFFYVYLVGGHDLTRIVEVRFHAHEAGAAEVVYSQQPLNEVDAPTAVAATPTALPGGARHVYRAGLAGLAPGATYHFQVRGADGSQTAPQRFTLPDGKAPLRFIEGGDLGTDKVVREMLTAAAATDPSFIVLGGDLAYANADPDNLYRWDAFFAMWCEHLVTPDGDLIPAVAGIGNHDVNPDVGQEDAQRAPYYRAFFGPPEGPVYFTRHAGELAAFFMLDTEYLHPIEGAQTDWLAGQLEAHADAAYTFAVYHEPLFPVHARFDNPEAVLGRAHWVPHFDTLRLTAAFEHHDHALKRTHPIYAGHIAERGTVYVGDGCVGMAPRTTDQQDAWYLAHAASKRHFWVVELDAAMAKLRAVGEGGVTLDAFTVPARRPQTTVAAHLGALPAGQSAGAHTDEGRLQQLREEVNRLERRIREGEAPYAPQ